jgi:hypothetical protein
VNIIPYTDIAVITKHQIKIDLEKLDADAALIEQQLLQIAEEMREKYDLAEFEWNKIKELEFQEKYKERNVLLASLKSYQCTHCPDLIDHVSCRITFYF